MTPVPVSRVAVLTGHGLADVLALARQNRRELYRAQPVLASALPALPATRPLLAAAMLPARGHQITLAGLETRG